MAEPSARVRLLAAATDRGGHRAMAWVTAPLAGARNPVEVTVDDAGRVGRPTDDVVALRAAPADGDGSGRRSVRARPGALPLDDGAVDGVALLLVLPALARLDDVFAELRRVLRPAGTLVVIVPSARIGSRAELRLRQVTGRVHRAWRHRAALDRTDWLLAAADFAVVEQHRIGFTLPLPDAATAHRLVDELPGTGLWPHRLPDRERHVAAAAMARRAGPGAVLPVPLRRLVARR